MFQWQNLAACPTENNNAKLTSNDIVRVSHHGFLSRQKNYA